MSKMKKQVDFVGKGKMFGIISIVLIVATIIVAFFGVKVSIEFKGGTLLAYSYEGDIDVNEVQSELESIVGSDINIQHGENFQSGTKNITISFGSDEGLTVENQSNITSKLKEVYADSNISILDSNDVNPSAGKQFFIKCLVAVLFATILLVIYIAWRFKRISGWSAGVCAIIALLHDAFFVFATFVFCGFELDSNFIAVVLTIFGYSVNDTIVIYDRIRENKKLLPNEDLKSLVNLSLNQTVVRSLRTSGMAILSVTVVAIVAVVNNIDSILSFTVPLIVGMLFGSYSSICIVPSIWHWWNERKVDKSKDVKKGTKAKKA
ncbi:MAG TPA: protein translocase subunit SecF [Clostridiales bacterium]|nr:protein translocase subunit SecF [Clostridiales bacterium]